MWAEAGHGTGLPLTLRKQGEMRDSKAGRAEAGPASEAVRESNGP